MGRTINNDFYEELNEKWLHGDDHPVALLRAENRLRIPFIAEKIAQHMKRSCRVLDIGCGAGFLTNALAEKGHLVTGIDQSPSSLATAHRADRTQTVSYLEADAGALPFADESFDAVTALDLLEHVPHPAKVVAEASRVLRKDGLFFFYTFNRNPWSWLLVIKGVEWCVKNTPKNMHLYNMFIKPEELTQMCVSQQLRVDEACGMSPDMKRKAFWKMVFTRRVSEDLSFEFTKSLRTGYLLTGSKL